MKILVADDDAGLREKLKQHLANSGFEVETARDGREAFALVCDRLDEFDAVITDMQMPHMTGHGILQAMYRGNRTPPALLHSSDSVAFIDIGQKRELIELSELVKHFEFARFHLKSSTRDFSYIEDFLQSIKK